MTYRPYPNRDRALRQIARHEDETTLLQASVGEPLSIGERFRLAGEAMKAASPSAQQFLSGMTRSLTRADSTSATS